MASEEELSFKVEQWDRDGNRIESVIATEPTSLWVVALMKLRAVRIPRRGSRCGKGYG